MWGRSVKRILNAGGRRNRMAMELTKDDGICMQCGDKKCIRQVTMFPTVVDIPQQNPGRLLLRLPPPTDSRYSCTVPLKMKDIQARYSSLQFRLLQNVISFVLSGVETCHQLLNGRLPSSRRAYHKPTLDDGKALKAGENRLRKRK